MAGLGGPRARFLDTATRWTYWRPSSRSAAAAAGSVRTTVERDLSGEGNVLLHNSDGISALGWQSPSRGCRS